MEKLAVEKIPVTDELRPVRRIVQERGELALLEDGPAFHHLACFTLRPGPGFFRGGHVHRAKVEHFYVQSGRGVLQWADPSTGRTGSVELEAGDKVTILPGLAHLFRAVEELVVVEYYEGVYDSRDDIPFAGFDQRPS